MDLPYQRKIRGLYSRLGDINEADIQELDELGFTQHCDIEDTIKQAPEIGNRQLIGTLNALLEEHRHLEIMVNAKIENLVEGGMFYTDQQCLITREVLLNMEDTIAYLLELVVIYFPKDAAKNLELIKEFYPQIAKRVKEAKKKSGRRPTNYESPTEVFINEGMKARVDKAIADFEKEFGYLSNEDKKHTAISDICRVLIQNGATKKGIEFKGFVKFMGKYLKIHGEFTDRQLNQVHQTNIAGDFLVIFSKYK